MGIDDVDGDFKKARAFLLTYSTLILILWYFSVDLKGFNFLGVAIEIRDNVENVHLVAALGNLYFLIRFFQKAPSGSFKLDSDMVSVFESALKTVAPYVYMRMLYSSMVEVSGIDGVRGKFRKFEKDVTMGHQLADTGSSVLKYIYYRNPERAKRVELSMSVAFLYFRDGVERIGQVKGKRIVPGVALILFCRIYAFIKGSLITAWFTDYILPVLYALASIAVSFLAWWQVNHVL